MKKPNLNRIIWEIRLQRKIIACQIWNRNVRRHQSMTGGDRSKTTVISIPVLHAEKIESRKKIQQVLDSAWTTLRKGSSKLKLDFSRTHKIFLGGMLSSTGLPFRGNGLPEMKDFVALTDSGRMSIISGHAQYTYSVSGGGNGYQCDVETLGTLILWNIPLIHKQLT
ncbi:MAG: hypothetical protein QM533_08605 [Cytophagales bacterium]|nr:hypothetical protein [Cytophagales bacterium]